METVVIRIDGGEHIVRKDFPVGREWKHNTLTARGKGRRVVRKDFPVGREWETIDSNYFRLVVQLVRKDFPVGREWKLSRNIKFKKHPESPSERTFPLEGNGNYASSSDPPCSAFSRPKGLSRWKGMETNFCNSSCAISATIVRKDFPVGREWKLFRTGFANPLVRVVSERDFPVGRGMETLPAQAHLYHV